MKIFFIAPAKLEYVEITSSIKQAVNFGNESHSVTAFNEVDIFLNSSSATSFEDEIFNCDLIIADVSEENSFVLYEIGIAKANKKGIILIAHKNSFIPLFIVTGYNIHYYNRNRLEETLIEPLKYQLSSKTVNDTAQSIKLKDKEIKTVFISYSTHDKHYKERLLIHINPLQKFGNFAYWTDDKSGAGQIWREEIEKALDKAAIAILLISANFLASDFIVNNELPVLLKSAEKKGTHIITIIVKPCLFEVWEDLNKFQAINPLEKPLSKLTENDSEEYFVKAAKETLSVAKKILPQ